MPVTREQLAREYDESAAVFCRLKMSKERYIATALHEQELQGRVLNGSNAAMSTPGGSSVDDARFRREFQADKETYEALGLTEESYVRASMMEAGLEPCQPATVTAAQTTELRTNNPAGWLGSKLTESYAETTVV